MMKSFGRAAALLAVGASVTVGGCAPESADELADARVEGHSQALSTGPALIATGSLDLPTDFAPFSDLMESGLSQNVLGGLGSGLASAGGTTFLGVPDRGPNATAYTGGTPVDNTTTFISRFETLDLTLSPAISGSLPFALTPTLQATTLLYSASPLSYGSTAGLPSGVPTANGAGKFYFSGRSDNFGAGLSTSPDFGRFDPEGIVVSNDGSTVFIADEYGPFVYQFDRATGRRLRAYALPERFAATNLNSMGALEISGNTAGRVTNKGMEGLAITPDGATLVGLMQSPLLQDGGDGGRANRIVTIDVATGATHEYVYDNQIGIKAYNSSEIIALNDHQFLIDTRDGKGLGDGSAAVIKQLWAVDIAGAVDVSALSGQAVLLANAAPKQRFLDMVASLNANGIVSTQIPAKIEGLAFGNDVVLNGVVTHTLYVSNDNDFVPAIAGPNRWFVFGFNDEDLAALGLSYVPRNITERGADLSLSHTAAAPSVVTGSTVDYALTVTNTGLVPATGVSVADLLAPELALTACTSSGGCMTSPGGATLSFDRLLGDASQTATLSAKLSCVVADGTLITSRASASFAAADPTPADNTANAAITAINPAPVVSNISVSEPVKLKLKKGYKQVTVAYSVADNCPDTVCTLSAVAIDKKGRTKPSMWSVLDSHTLEARGEGDQRTSITISCQDSGGATTRASASLPRSSGG